MNSGYLLNLMEDQMNDWEMYVHKWHIQNFKKSSRKMVIISLQRKLKFDNFTVDNSMLKLKFFSRWDKRNNFISQNTTFSLSPSLINSNKIHR